MPARSNSPNHFLASLSPEDYALIQPHLRPIELPQGLVLYMADDGIERVYFPHNGVISLVVGLVDGRFVEAGMFGRNGVVGGGAALDGRKAINQAVAQVAGSGLTIEMGLLSRFVSESDTLRMAPDRCVAADPTAMKAATCSLRSSSMAASRISPLAEVANVGSP